MTTLYLGLALFFVAHFIPIFARPLRNRAAEAIGAMPYKGLFAVVLLVSLYLIITGWKAAAGAGIAAVTGGDITRYALAGAAAGALAGYFVDKNDKCDGYDRDGYLDDDCFDTRGYPVDPRY